MKAAAEKLGEYRRKRRANATNEPFGGELEIATDTAGTLSGAYVVHLHDATRRHYDLRLEVGGVLASFAVPRGPSLDPNDKALAVKTEDHPLEYLDFEDVIPAKQYGAGPMIAWDRGMVTYLEGPAEEEIANGKIHVELRGLKLRGRYALVKLAKSAKGDEWLLFKKNDDYASAERKLVDELPRSVFSGLTIEELERASSIGDALVRRASAMGAKRLRPSAMRSLLAPSAECLMPSVTKRLPRASERDAWVYDVELDGIRVLATRDGDEVRIHSFERGTSVRIEGFYPEIVRALRALPAQRVAIDGLLVAFDASGHPSSKLIAQRVAKMTSGDTLRAMTATPVALVAHDLLALGDADVRSLTLVQRRELLAALLPELGFVRATATLEGPLQPIVDFCAAHAMARVIAKKQSSLYEPSSRTEAWVAVPTGVPASTTKVDHRAADSEAVLRRVTITNRRKVFWPDEGYTKGDLCDYYESVADVILPYFANRPVILVRYPDGVRGKNFYQWNVPPGMPPWIHTLSVSDEIEGPKRGFLIEDVATLLYIANLACIPLHILACRVPDLRQADFFTVDFDVKQSELRHAISLARRLHEILDEIGLPSFPKTSGQSGLHVLVPLGRNQTFETARALADVLGRLLVDEFPEIATMERIVARRGPRVYVDTGQTGQTRAIVGPYSVRAVPGATVSMPLEWDAIRAGLDPRAFTIKTVPKLVAKHGDAMRGLFDARPDVANAVLKLQSFAAKEGTTRRRPRASSKR